LDSAWNTNGSTYELYALLGEVCGSGCPLGYLLLHSSDQGDSGGKEWFIAKLLSYFKNTWDLQPIITLTDKDFSEINAFLKTFPDAKHQLCFWHCLQAIKTWLAILH
jgi:MULE transposase domain